MSNLVQKDSREVSTNLASKVEAALIEGDLAKMTADEKLVHYKNVCDSLGLNPHTKPFGYIHLKGKLTLYALRAATDQLRSLHGVSVVSTATSVQNNIATVTCVVRDKNGREDSDIGCVSLAGLGGEELANAYMKAVTKAKRRATLSLCGLGWLDETEVETIREAKVIAPADAHKPKKLEPKAEPKPAEAIQTKKEASASVALEKPSEDFVGELVTKQQLKTISNLLKEANFTQEELENWKGHMREEYGVDKSTDLAFEAAEALIADLQSLVGV